MQEWALGVTECWCIQFLRKMLTLAQLSRNPHFSLFRNQLWFSRTRRTHQDL